MLKLLPIFVTLELVAYGIVPRGWIVSTASIHFIIGGGKGKTYVLAKKTRLIHKIFKSKERTVIANIS